MLIGLPGLIQRHDLQIRGIIHVGAHHGQEYQDYVDAGVIDIVFVEPCKQAFNVLRQLHGHKPGVSLFNYALGEEVGTATMHVERANTGMSNSLLKPALHQEHYPNIVFDNSEDVSVRRLDGLAIDDRKKYNLLMMDVQGYEKYVLRGGSEVLKGIDYIYTEVNDQELYEGCTKIEELDVMLAPEFRRVETKWAGDKGWGDAVYIRDNIPPREIGVCRTLVPQKFQQHHPFPYPPDNHLIFEEWFYRQAPIICGRKYLPVFWTGFYVKHFKGPHSYFLDMMKSLQAFLDNLDRSVKYYTIVQYDDGIMHNLAGLDIKVFAMSGPRVDYPLPLLCSPHQWGKPSGQRKYLANFIGKITHPMREMVLAAFTKRDDVFISTAKFPLDFYVDKIANSIFTLCPRGYGVTSFRILEAIQQGSIPVYISDEFIFPHGINFEDYGIVIHENEIESLPKLLAEISVEDIERMRIRGRELYVTHFTFEGCYEIMKQVLTSEQ